MAFLLLHNYTDFIQKVPIKFYYNVYYYYLFKNLDVIYVIYRIKYDLLVTYL